MELPL